MAAQPQISGSIRRRNRFFVACEGKSEVGYCRLLTILAEEALAPENVRFHLDTLDLRGGGDLGAIIRNAAAVAATREKANSPFQQRFLMLDLDVFSQHQIQNLVASQPTQLHGFSLVRQDPDFEALLLRHFPGCESMRPPKGRSENNLRRHWPLYSKAMSGNELRRMIGIDGVRRAATVEPDLKQMLNAIRFPL
jgi:hypothetical protein